MKNIEINKKFYPLLDRNSKYRTFCFYGGRDSTKSWGIAISLIVLSHNNPDLLFLCVKGTMTSISDSVKQLIEQTIYWFGLESYYKITDSEIIHNYTNSRFIFKGLQKAERLKSTEGVDYCWIEEANIDTKEETFEKLLPTIRKQGSKIVISFNPSVEDEYVYKRYIKNSTKYDYICKLTYLDNKFLSMESKIEIENLKEKNFMKYLHIYEGEVNGEVEGAYWTHDMIAYDRDENEFDRVIVAIDPAVTSTGHQDACGLIVAGQKGKSYWIIEDASGVMSPEQWAQKAVSLYNKYEADHITYETNQGGDLVKIIINNIQPIRCIGVHASKNKMARAEPISFLYERDLVRHRKPFTDLEYEMVTYSGDPKQKSPNRLDALVWALTDLSRLNKNPRGMVKADLNQFNKDMRVGIMRPRVSSF